MRREGTAISVVLLTAIAVLAVVAIGGHGVVGSAAAVNGADHPSVFDVQLETNDGAYTVAVPGHVDTTVAEFESETSNSVTLTGGPVLEDLVLTLADEELVQGEQTEATVTAHYSDGTSVDVTDQATITSASPIVATVDGSTVTAEFVDGGGSTWITAGFDGVTSNRPTILVLEPPEPEPVELTLESEVLNEGEQAVATVTAHNDDGTSEDVTTQATITSSNATVATVESSTVAAVSNGTAEITAEYDGNSSIPVTVTVGPVLESVELTLADDELPEGEWTEATVMAHYSDDTSEDVTDQSIITSDETAVASVEGSTVLAEGLGSTSITAGFDGVTSNRPTILVVEPPELESVDLDLAEEALTEGEQTEATVTANYDDGSSEDVTDGAEITSTDPTIATVDDSTVHAVADGTVTITAAFGGETSDPVTLTVQRQPELESLVLSLGEDIITEDQQTEATVTAHYDDGTSEDVTDEAIITSADSSVASVDGSTVTANGDGTTTITAEYDGESSDPVTLTVGYVLEDLVLTLADADRPEGAQTQATVLAHYHGGTSADVADQASISSADPLVATVDGSTVTAERSGSTTIIAGFAGVTSNEEPFTVSSADPGPVELSLESEVLNESEETGVTVTAHFADGSSADVTDVAEITSSNATVATVESSTVTAVNNGTTEIIAEYDGNSSTPVTLTVGPVLEEVVLILTDEDLYQGEQTEVTVTAHYSDGTSVDVTDQATITSASPIVATVEGSTVTAEFIDGGGSTWITAGFDGVTSNRPTILVLELSEPESVELDLADETLTEGEQTEATVTAHFDDGTSVDVTDQATITSSNATVASIEGASVIAEGEGKAYITAEFKGVISNQSVLTVTSGQSVAKYADEETGVVGTDGLRNAIDDWRNGEINTVLLRDVIDAWRSGEQVGG